MAHQVGVGIDQGQFDIVILMHHQQRTGDRAVEGHGPDFGVVGDRVLFLFDHHGEFDDFWSAGRDLLMGMHEWRGDEVDLDAFERADVDGGCRGGGFLGGCREHGRHLSSCANRCCADKQSAPRKKGCFSHFLLLDPARLFLCLR
ncbi:hypothetical protein D3C87_1664370 [compost metagenome]